MERIPHWKIRVVIKGALIHLASKTQTVWRRDSAFGLCDTGGCLDWDAVTAVTWRYVP